MDEFAEKLKVGQIQIDRIERPEIRERERVHMMSYSSHRMTIERLPIETLSHKKFKSNQNKHTFTSKIYVCDKSKKTYLHNKYVCDTRSNSLKGLIPECMPTWNSKPHKTHICTDESSFATKHGFKEFP